MPKERKNPNCITATIKICGDAMKVIHKKQGEAILNGNRISVETAINQLLVNLYNDSKEERN